MEERLPLKRHLFIHSFAKITFEDYKFKSLLNVARTLDMDNHELLVDEPTAKHLSDFHVSPAVQSHWYGATQRTWLTCVLPRSFKAGCSPGCNNYMKMDWLISWRWLREAFFQVILIHSAQARIMQYIPTGPTVWCCYFLAKTCSRAPRISIGWRMRQRGHHSTKCKY